MMRVLTIAAVAAATALASVPAYAQKLQGGSAPALQLDSLGVSRDNGAQRRIRNEVKALREEAIAIRNQNGGIIPEAERVRLQTRYNELRKAFLRAG